MLLRKFILAYAECALYFLPLRKLPEKRCQETFDCLELWIMQVGLGLCVVSKEFQDLSMQGIGEEFI